MANIGNAEISVRLDGLVQVGPNHMVRLRDIVLVQRRSDQKGRGTAIEILPESDRLRGAAECVNETTIISDWEFDKVVSSINDAQTRLGP